MYEANLDTAEIFIYDEIGASWYGGIDSGTVIKSLAELSGRPITVRLNSPGGDVVEAIAIYNALDRHRGQVDVKIDSLAASAASYIAMVGDTITIADNAMLMIHSPWTFAMGNAADIRKTADLLDKFQDSLSIAYSEQSKKSKEEVDAIIAAETWFTAKEALAAGFVDKIGDKSNAYACVPRGRFESIPEQFISAGTQRFAAGIRRQQPEPAKKTPLLDSVVSSLARRKNT